MQVIDALQYEIYAYMVHCFKEPIDDDDKETRSAD